MVQMLNDHNIDASKKSTQWRRERRPLVTGGRRSFPRSRPRRWGRWGRGRGRGLPRLKKEGRVGWERWGGGGGGWGGGWGGGAGANGNGGWDRGRGGVGWRGWREHGGTAPHVHARHRNALHRIARHRTAVAHTSPQSRQVTARRRPRSDRARLFAAEALPAGLGRQANRRSPGRPAGSAREGCAVYTG